MSSDEEDANFIGLEASIWFTCCKPWDKPVLKVTQRCFVNDYSSLKVSQEVRHDKSVHGDDKEHNHDLITSGQRYDPRCAVCVEHQAPLYEALHSIHEVVECLTFDGH